MPGAGAPRTWVGSSGRPGHCASSDSAWCPLRGDAGTRWDFGVRRWGERGVPTVPVSRPSVLSCFSSYAPSGARERWGRGLGHPRIHLRRRRLEFHSPRVPRTPSLIWGHSDIQDPSRIPGGHPPPRPSRPCGSPAEALYPSPTLRLAAASEGGTATVPMSLRAKPFLAWSQHLRLGPRFTQTRAEGPPISLKPPF